MQTTTATDVLIRNLAALGCILQGKALPSLPYVVAYAGQVEAIWYLDLAGDRDRQRQAVEALITSLGGTWTTSAGPEFSDWRQQHPGVLLQVRVERAAVCERVVVGTHEVTREVVDPDAPKITETVTVEDVEWRCPDLLAEVVIPAQAPTAEVTA